MSAGEGRRRAGKDKGGLMGTKEAWRGTQERWRDEEVFRKGQRSALGDEDTQEAGTNFISN